MRRFVLLVSIALSCGAYAEPHRGKSATVERPAAIRHPDPIREIEEKDRDRNAPKSVDAILEDPQWFCDANQKIQEPRQSAHREVVAAFRKTALVKDKFDSLLVDTLDLAGPQALLRLDQIARKYNEADQPIKIRMMMLKACLESFPGAHCSYYADMYLEHFDGADPSPTAACRLAVAYAYSAEHQDIARNFIKICGKPEFIESVEDQLSSKTAQPRFPQLLALAFSDDPWDVDRYSRIVLGFSPELRKLLQKEFQEIFGLAVSECDLLRPHALLEKPEVFAVVLANPALVGAALQSLARHSEKFPKVIKENPPLEETLIRLMVSKKYPQLMRYAKDLGPVPQERLKRVNAMIDDLPKIRDDAPVSLPTMNKDFETDRRLFSKADDLGSLVQQLNSTSWRCEPDLVSVREQAKENLKENFQLKKEFAAHRPVYEKELLMKAAAGVNAWQSGKISNMQLTLLLDSLQSRIPELDHAKKLLRALTVEVTPTEFRNALIATYGAPEYEDVKHILPLALSHGEGRQLYHQLLFQMPKYALEDFRAENNVPKPCDFVNIGFGAREFSLMDVLSRGQVVEGMTSIAPELRRLLEEETSYDVWATQTLQKIGPGALPEAIKLLSSNKNTPVMHGLELLKGFREQSLPALPKVMALAKNRWMPVRRSSALSVVEAMGPAASGAIPELITIWNENGEPVRSDVVRTLSAMRDKVIPAMMALLATESLPHALLAAEVLGNLGPIAKDAVAGLTELLSSSDLQSRTTALFALEKIGPTAASAIPKIVECIDDEKTAKMAISALGSMGPLANEHVPKLRKFLSGAQPEDVQIAAIEALGKIPMKDENAKLVVEDLVQSVTRRDKFIAVKAALTLGTLKGAPDVVVPQLIRWISQPDVLVASAKQAIANYGETAVPALEKILLDSTLDKETRRQAAERLADLESDAAAAIPSLVKSISDKEPSIAKSAMFALWVMGDKAVPPILKALDDRSEITRTNAIKVLDVMARSNNSVPAARPKLNKLASDEHIFVRVAALRALGDSPYDKTSFDILVKALDDREDVIREQAVTSISHFRGHAKVIVPRLLEALEKKDSLLGALQMLTEIGAESSPALPRLRQILRTPEGQSEKREIERAIRSIERDVRKASR